MKWLKNPFRRKESKTMSIFSSQDNKVTWPERDYSNFSKETYLKNVTAFRAIDYVAKSIASVAWKEFKNTNEKPEEIKDSVIAKMLRKRANPSESFSFFILKTAAYLVMSGNAFLEKVGPISGPNKNQVKELYSLRPDRFTMEVSNGRVSKYTHKIESRETSWEVDPKTGGSNILQLKTFHPLNDIWGAAPTESGAREIDTSNASTEWNKSLLDNQGRPGMVYTLIGKLGSEQFDYLERYLRESHSGPSNVGKDLILTGERGTGAAPYGWSPTDMDFGEGDLRLMRKIAMIYGVQPMLLGIPGEATFANYKEARLAFWEDTVFFWLRYLKEEINNWIYEEDSDTYIDYVLDDIPALSIKRDQLWERAQKSTFLSVNEQREMVGKDSLGPIGDVVLIDSNKIPLGMEDVEDTTKEDTTKTLEEGGFQNEDIIDFLSEDYTKI